VDDTTGLFIALPWSPKPFEAHSRPPLFNSLSIRVIRLIKRTQLKGVIILDARTHISLINIRSNLFLLLQAYKRSPRLETARNMRPRTLYWTIDTRHFSNVFQIRDPVRRMLRCSCPPSLVVGGSHTDTIEGEHWLSPLIVSSSFSSSNLSSTTTAFQAVESILRLNIRLWYCHQDQV